jgi:hypothetical protein
MPDPYARPPRIRLKPDTAADRRIRRDYLADLAYGAAIIVAVVAIACVFAVPWLEAAK